MPIEPQVDGTGIELSENELTTIFAAPVTKLKSSFSIAFKKVVITRIMLLETTGIKNCIKIAADEKGLPYKLVQKWS